MESREKSWTDKKGNEDILRTANNKRKIMENQEKTSRISRSHNKKREN